MAGIFSPQIAKLVDIGKSVALGDEELLTPPPTDKPKFGDEDKELLNNQQIGSNAVNPNNIPNNQGSNNEIESITYE